jgi:hypothetical protein
MGDRIRHIFSRPFYQYLQSLWCALMILSIGGLISGCTSHPPTRIITIGIASSFENATSEHYLDCQRGATLAIEEWNLKGGPLGLLVREKRMIDSQSDTNKKENRTSQMVAIIIADDSWEGLKKTILRVKDTIPVFCISKTTTMHLGSSPKVFILSIEAIPSYQQDSVYHAFQEKYQKRFMANETPPDTYLAYMSVNLTLNAIVRRVSIDNDVLLEEIRKDFIQNQGVFHETTHP